MADAGEDVGGILLDAHAAAATVALLAAPEFVVEKGLVDGDAGGEAADKGDQAFAVAFAGGGESEHCPLLGSGGAGAFCVGRDWVLSPGPERRL